MNMLRESYQTISGCGPHFNTEVKETLPSQDIACVVCRSPLMRCSSDTAHYDLQRRAATMLALSKKIVP